MKLQKYYWKISLLESIVIIVSLAFVSTTFAQKHLADRDTEGFKAAIKVVTTTRADLKKRSGKWIEGKRMPESYVTYDSDGNRAIEKLYEDGNISNSVVYKLLDGDRVMMSDGTEIVSNGIDIVADLGTPQKAPQPPDERYNEKFKYKYDDNGTVREEAIYENDGRYNQTKVVTLKKNQREEKVYIENRKLNSRYVYNLDDQGNEIEMLSFEADDQNPSWKENYKNLEFDSQGNWTKRIATQYYGENGKYILKSTTAFYRTISYF